MNDPKLKLFVVGESSGDPDEWSGEGGYSIVIAHDETEAMSFSPGGPVAEIPLTKVRQLVFVGLRIL
jgi:hypothetical protein